MEFTGRRGGVLPGFGISLGVTVTWLSLVVLIPLSTLFVRSARLSPHEFVAILTEPRVLASFRVTVLSALVAALVNGVLGLLLAWVLVRYPFPGRRVVDALVDLPFALPTAVAGITLATVHGPNGWVGRVLEPLGIQVAFTPLGIVVAMIFIGLPFVVRTVQPVIEDLEPEIEEAAACLGAGRLQTVSRVILPLVVPSLLTGVALAFARGVGEYGSVIFIAGNMPMVSEILPLVIVTRLEQYDYDGATAIAVVMLMVSATILLAINLLQRWSRRFGG